ncbi:hypothetical protein FHS85_000342 [Rhodoligotrophos appendicifer]|uniref:hypothetical protein n=1 Tax=Rhodoligotrophos appendicifer TaxID=987056 RepID=UPI00117D6AC1|nr:hypothetical protein [Rhodoligotrophos appendicifer]
MRKLIGLSGLLLVLTSLSASAQLMDDQKFALQSYCGEGIKKYCPQVDVDDLDALWDCLSPHWDQMDPMCKATVQEIQEN